jgi:hypothetical protein
MFFSFAGGREWVLICPVAVLDYFPSVGVGKSHMVCDAHLFFCSFTEATLELANGKRWPTFLSAAWHRAAFHGLGIQDVTEFDSD